MMDRVILSRGAGLLVVGLTIVHLSCKHAPTEPVTPPKDPRTYTFTVDTLAYPGNMQTLMSGIWGNSAQNVYVVGSGDGGFGKMYHFDGRSWTDVKLGTLQGGTISGSIDLYSIFGFSATNISAVGERIYDNPSPPPNFLDSSLIIQYNGQQWREHRITGRYLHTIWASGPQDMWVSGAAGTLWHFNGQSWLKDSLPIVPAAGTTVYTIYGLGGTSPNDVYALAWVNQNAMLRDTYYFLQRDGSSWALVDTFVNQPGMNQHTWGENSLWASPWGTLYSTGIHGVYRLDGRAWTKILDAFHCKICGTSENNLFVTSVNADFEAQVLHFNGTDWFQYDNIPHTNLAYNACWNDGQALFVVGYTFGSYPQKSIILRSQ
jgi:hypothetical protein